MSRNIKEIGKELMGKSLNSFHRKTGLTQLEENNKMQDGILDGILSQVDDAYIEKTEQSNVIHLDGSGDGVVVVDSIEGNTLVNLWDFNSVRVNGQAVKTDTTIKIKTTDNRWSNFFLNDKEMFKPSTEYTFIIDVKKNTLTDNSCIVITSSAGGTNRDVFEGYHIGAGKTGIFKKKLTTISDFSQANYGVRSFFDNTTQTLNCEVELNIIILEGDWTNKEIPASYFTGLQSSFEEKVNDEGKYEIEILSKNKNLYNVEDVNIDSWMNSGGATVSKINNNIVLNGTISNYFDFRTVQSSWNANLTKLINKLPTGTTLTMSNNLTSEKNTINYWSVIRDGVIKYFTNTLTIQKGDTEIGGFVRFQNGTVLNNTILKVQIEVNNKATSYTISKQNKIKLLLDEPLRSLENVKDKLYIKDNKLTIKRNYGELVLNNNSNIEIWNSRGNCIDFRVAVQDVKHSCKMLSDKFTYLSWNTNDVECCTVGGSSHIYVRILKSKLSEVTVQGFKTWLQSNPTKIVYELAEPFYEEVLNEYGEPIILEGYENGTIYIDSTIVPTTTVRYTPKMQSFKTLKEVNDNNIMLTNDINDNIIPYLMDVDLMIMEKEMALPSQINIRKMEALDMTSMQKRTQDMLERLIKGKTLTEQECKTRITTYLNAGKITDTQAEELNFLIDEIYA